MASMEIDPSADTAISNEALQEQVEVPDELSILLEEADDILELQRGKALELLNSVLNSNREDDTALRLKEQAIIK